MKQLWFAMSLVTGSLLFSANALATPRRGVITADEPGQSVTELRAVIYQHQ